MALSTFLAAALLILAESVRVRVMNRRIRALSALVMLITMVFSFAETAVAAMCVPTMEMGVPAMQDMMQDMEGAAVQMDCADAHPHEQHQDDERPGDCPFAPAGMTQGCAAPASLPASGSVAPAASPDVAMVFSPTEVEPHLLLGSTLFHPPKS